MRYAIFIGYRVPVSNENSPCYITIRHQTVSGGDVNMCIATHPISICRTALPDSVSEPLTPTTFNLTPYSCCRTDM